MGEVRSKLGIINLCLARAGKDPLASLDAPNTPDGKNAVAFYQDQIEVLLAGFPWPFIAKRVPLEEDGGDTEKFSRRFRPPTDIKYIWDIYTSKRDYLHYPTTWDLNYIPYEVWGGRTLFNRGDEFEIIGDHIETDYTQVYLYYTPDVGFSIERANEQFVTLLKDKVRLDLLAAKGTDVERLAFEHSRADRRERDAIARQSQENQKAVSLPRAQIVSRLDSWGG